MLDGVGGADVDSEVIRRGGELVLEGQVVVGGVFVGGVFVFAEVDAKDEGRRMKAEGRELFVEELAPQAWETHPVDDGASSGRWKTVGVWGCPVGDGG